jgi:negative regulator of flagellin synthesis FlgM
LIDAVNPGEAPVDTDRVAVIRKAVESGTYPVFPAKIADAMIAAGMLLTKGN